MMNILCIGDIVGKAGRNAVNELVPKLREELALDFVIANAENAAGGSGVTDRIATQLYRFGCDVLTMGDHVWDRPELEEVLNSDPRLIRPANFPEGAPGKGWCIVESAGGIKVGVVNLVGRVFMRYQVDCPFRALDQIIPQIQKETPIIVVDFHAETTSEKVAFGHYSEGRVTAVVGTHTHIQTADETILGEKTAYITDLGMTGPYDSVIGQNKKRIIQRFLTSRPVRFEVAKDEPRLMGAVISIDENTGWANKITRIQRSLV
jgi:2',3'-cyclic-nucleotide 2'-phosphodiesterase